MYTETVCPCIPLIYCIYALVTFECCPCYMLQSPAPLYCTMPSTQGIVVAYCACYVVACTCACMCSHTQSYIYMHVTNSCSTACIHSVGICKHNLYVFWGSSCVQNGCAIERSFPVGCRKLAILPLSYE